MLDLDSGCSCGNRVSSHVLRWAHAQLAPPEAGTSGPQGLLAMSAVAQQDEEPCVNKLTALQQALEVALD